MAAPVDGPGDTKSTRGWQGATARSLHSRPEMPILSLMNESPSPEWLISEQPVPYQEALATMEARVAEIRAGRARELVWLLEHPPLYTAGTSARAADLLQPVRFPVHAAGRGGQYTYHGPGQRVAYVMLDLRRRRCDVDTLAWPLISSSLLAVDVVVGVVVVAVAFAARRVVDRS